MVIILALLTGVGLGIMIGAYFHDEFIEEDVDYIIEED